MPDVRVWEIEFLLFLLVLIWFVPTFINLLVPLLSREFRIWRANKKSDVDKDGGK